MAKLESHHGYYLWRYVPSAAAAIIVALLFAIATGAHIWRIYKTRTWFCISFSIGGLFEFIGYCARCAAHSKTGHLMPFVIQNTYILVAPALFAASIYMTLGRVIRSVKGERHAVIRPSWLTRTFVFGDIFSFCVQGGAAGLMVIGNGKARLGQVVVLVGLMTQVIMFGLFALSAVIFEVRLRRDLTPESLGGSVPWRGSLRMLYGVSVLIATRSMFRVVEFAMGQDGYALSHEWTLYVFDSVLMLVVMGVFYWRFPSKLRSAPDEDEHVRLETQFPKA